MKYRASVTFEKIVDYGLPAYKMVSSKGVLKQTELPYTYVNGDLFFYTHSNGLGIVTDVQYYRYGIIFNEVQYTEFTTHLTQCGHRLTQVLKDEMQLRKTHNGTIVFKV